MPDTAENGSHWPRFETVTFSEPTGIPYRWDRELVSKGVPKELLGAYQAAKALTLLEMPAIGQFVCFGTCGRNDRICLDPRTGAVVDIILLSTRTINQASGIHGPPIFVNSSLGQFIAAVRAVVNRFPFESGSPDQEQDGLANPWESIAKELFEALRRIDPAAMSNLDGFWMTFVSDVQMGDYSTEMVLRDPIE